MRLPVVGSESKPRRVPAIPGIPAVAGVVPGVPGVPKLDLTKSRHVSHGYNFTLSTLLHSERPKLYTILAFLTAIGLLYSKSFDTSKSRINEAPLLYINSDEWCKAQFH